MLGNHISTPAPVYLHSLKSSLPFPLGPGSWRHAGPDWLRRRPGYGMIGTGRTDYVGPTTKQAGTHDTARPGRKEDS